MSTVDHGGIKYRIPKRKEHRVCDCWSGTDYTVFFLNGDFNNIEYESQLFYY